MDYRSCCLSLPEKGKVWIISLGAAALAAYLFFNHWIALLLALPFYPVLCRREQEKKQEQRQKELVIQFKDAMQAVSNALLAGFSLENSFVEAEREIRQQYGDASLMGLELERINRSVTLNRPIEALMEEFALRSDHEDIICFSEVLSYAKRGGGDPVKIIGASISRIQEKLEIEQEIEVLIASKQLEQKVMNVMPLFLLAYLRWTSPDYLKPLYKSLGGCLFMGICMAVYLLSMRLAEHITKIKV